MWARAWLWAYVATRVCAVGLWALDQGWRPAEGAVALDAALCHECWGHGTGIGEKQHGRSAATERPLNHSPLLLPVSGPAPAPTGLPLRRSRLWASRTLGPHRTAGTRAAACRRAASTRLRPAALPGVARTVPPSAPPATAPLSTSGQTTRSVAGGSGYRAAGRQRVGHGKIACVPLRAGRACTAVQRGSSALVGASSSRAMHVFALEAAACGHTPGVSIDNRELQQKRCA